MADEQLSLLDWFDKELEMAKTYIPKAVLDVHELAVFIARYGAVLRAAIVAVDPEAGAVYDTLATAVTAFDALRETLYPLQP